MNRRNLVISVLAVSLSLTGYSQEEPKIKHAPPSTTDPA